MSRKMTGIVKTFDRKSGKGFIITPSDGRNDVQLHVSALNLRDAEEILPRITRGILPRKWPAWTISGKCLSLFNMTLLV